VDFDLPYFKPGWDQNIRLFKTKFSGIKIIFPIRVEVYIAWVGGRGHYFCNTNSDFQKKRPVEMIKIHLTERNYSGART